MIQIFCACFFIVTLALLPKKLVAEEGYKLPRDFSLEEKITSTSRFFTIEALSGKYLGEIRKRYEDELLMFDLFDKAGEQAAVGVKGLVAKGVRVDVSDPEGSYLGRVEEVVLTFSPAKYRIYGKNGALLATASLNFWGTKFAVTSEGEIDRGKELAFMSRPLPSAGSTDKWKVFIADDKAIGPNGYLDTRLLVMLGAFQTDFEREDKADLIWEVD
jgi:hypothetical protein